MLTLVRQPRRGRPIVGQKAKRRMLTMRVTDELGERLEAAAYQSGRSLSAELEMRLERSFFWRGER